MARPMGGVNCYEVCAENCVQTHATLTHHNSARANYSIPSMHPPQSRPNPSTHPPHTPRPQTPIYMLTVPSTVVRFPPPPTSPSLLTLWHPASTKYSTPAPSCTHTPAPLLKAVVSAGPSESQAAAPVPAITVTVPSGERRRSTWLFHSAV